MQIKNHEHTSHLSYCTNIHAAEQWQDVLDGVCAHVPDIRSSVCPDPHVPFGLGLRVAAAAAATLEEPGAREQLYEALKQMNCYVFTINGFPYGNFHGSPVKEGAYKPDWADSRRLSYTNSLAHLLADIIPVGTNGTISTVPGSFKPWVINDNSLLDLIVDNLIAHVACLTHIQNTTGVHIALSLEPEPFCLLETIDETVAFFKRYLFSASAVKRLAQLTKMNSSDCEAALRAHIGVCYDVCHAAVEFENAKDSIAALQSEQITISKMQLSSALRVKNVTKEMLAALQAFAEPVYLHQVVQRSQSGELLRFKDLNDALSSAQIALGSEWRIHFHVPVFLNELEHFDTTQSFLKEILAIHKNDPITEHLEVETYTWDVLPEEYRKVNMSAAIARELEWVRSRL